MNDQEVKEMFKKERENAPQYVIKSLDEKPAKAGKYTISIEGVRSIVPMYMDFDGENWVNLKQATAYSLGDLSKVTYYDAVPSPKVTETKKLKP